MGLFDIDKERLAVAICAMIANPGVEDWLRAEPGKIRTLIEACLRSHSPAAGRDQDNYDFVPGSPCARWNTCGSSPIR